MRPVCPFCVIDDFVTAIPLGPGLFEFTCSRANKHRDGDTYTWQGTSEGPLSESQGTGPVPINDVREALLACLKPGEPWLEYGIIEERYRETAAEDFEILREEYGHRILGPPSKSQFTASAYLARALGDLREFGQVAHTTGRATGPWAYNGTISYWAVPPPGPPPDKRLTYEDANPGGLG